MKSEESFDDQYEIAKKVMEEDREVLRSLAECAEMPPLRQAQTREEIADLIARMDDRVNNPEGDFSLTRDFLLRRGYCCKLKCKNCPYEPRWGLDE